MTPIYVILHLALLAIVLACVGVFTMLATALLMALILLRPKRMSDGKAVYLLHRLNPADLGLQYETVQFAVRDEQTHRPMPIAGWWIPCQSGPSLSSADAGSTTPSRRTCLILHGYTDAKVGGIAWAPLLVSLGFNVMAIDLRAHGESGGVFSTAGFFERHDVNQVIDQIRAGQPDETQTLVLLGVSLGAAVAAAVAVERNDIAALILECPYVDFPHAVLSHLDRLGVPGRSIQRLALWFCRKIAAIDFRQVRPVDLIPRISCPLWLVQVEDDPFVPPKDRAVLSNALRQRPADAGIGEEWLVPNCYHVLAMNEKPQEYRQKLAGFLEHALDPHPAVAAR